MKRASLVLVALVVVALCVALFFRAFLQHWLAIHLGFLKAGPDIYYNFWSGFGSDIGEVAIFGGVVTMVRHVNCHEKGCWRLGVHQTPEGHKLCRKHVAKSKAELNLHEVHPDHA